MIDTPSSIDDRDHQPRTIYGVIIAKEDIVEIHQMTDQLLGIVHPHDPASAPGQPLVSWKPAREIHMLEAESYEAARTELEAVRGQMVGVGALDDRVEA